MMFSSKEAGSHDMFRYLSGHGNSGNSFELLGQSWNKVDPFQVTKA